MDLANGQDLYQLIKANKRLSEQTASILLYNMCTALSKLTKCFICWIICLDRGMFTGTWNWRTSCCKRRTLIRRRFSTSGSQSRSIARSWWARLARLGISRPRCSTTSRIRRREMFFRWAWYCSRCWEDTRRSRVRTTSRSWRQTRTLRFSFRKAAGRRCQMNASKSYRKCCCLTQRSGFHSTRSWTRLGCRHN